MAEVLKSFSPKEIDLHGCLPKPLIRRNALDADDIERLWDQLLVAPADGMERASFGEDVPGGIVIRPVKPGRE